MYHCVSRGKKHCLHILTVQQSMQTQLNATIIMLKITEPRAILNRIAKAGSRWLQLAVTMFD